jgi:hypothetical protein
MMESVHCTVTSIAFRTRVSPKKSNVKPFPSTASLLTCTRRGDVVVYLDNFTFLLAFWHNSFECQTGCLMFGLLILCNCKFPFAARRIWHSVDYHLSCSPCCKQLTHVFVYHWLLPERGHVTLDCKSPEPVWFATEETLGMLFVPTTRVFPDKVWSRNCTEE